MTFKVETKNGQLTVTDVATGSPIPWVHTVDIVMSPDSVPILYLGTLAFTAEITAGLLPSGQLAQASAPAPAAKGASGG